MRFYPLTTGEGDGEALRGEYAAAREIGRVRLGQTLLFLRSGLRVYYIPFSEIGRCFRRVQLIPAKMCCGRGNLEVENLVVCDSNDRELIQVQLPGTKAARILMEELRARAPGAAFGKPDGPAEA